MPIRCVTIWARLGLGEEDVLEGFVDAGDVCHEPVTDVGELQVRDERGAVVVGGEVVESSMSPRVGWLVARLDQGLGSDGFHVVFDGDPLGCFLGWVGG